MAPCPPGYAYALNRSKHLISARVITGFCDRHAESVT